jgi:hypothetical protein
MKPLYALSIAATLSLVIFLAFSKSAEALSLPVLETMRPLVSPVQYDPLQQYSPGRRQGSLAGRAAYCRCRPGFGLVCRYPGQRTTIIRVQCW